MARYMALTRGFEQTFAGPRQFEAGEIVHTDDAPGVALWPMDAEARATRAAVLAGKARGQRRRDEVLAARWRKSLPRHVRAQLDAADAEAVDDGPVTFTPPVRRSVSVGPATYPGTWSSTAGRRRLGSVRLNRRKRADG